MPQKKAWKKIFRYQKKSGWCGPAVIQMALASAGIKKAQSTIAKYVLQPWFGTTHHVIMAYLSQYFNKYGTKTSCKIKDIATHLEKGHTVIVNWWDDYEDKNSPPDGHYSLALDYDKKNRKLTLADPAGNGGIWKIDKKDFEKKWFDYLDVQKKKVIKGWIFWLDPKSKVSPSKKLADSEEVAKAIKQY